jgi:hypothetical protein
MGSEAVPGLKVKPDCVLEQFEAKQWGFLRLAVTASQITGEYTGVDRTGKVTPSMDAFSVPIAG